MFHFALVVTVLIAAASGAPGINDVSSDGRIVNGTDVKTGQYPFMVSLQPWNGQHDCGATIINENWVLTAAHCVHRYW